MSKIITLALCAHILYGCKDSVVQPSSINELLCGTYAGVTMYWIPSDSTPQKRMYCACPNDRTGIYLAPNGDFLMRIEAQVERRDTLYAITFSGYYEIIHSQYSGGGEESMAQWEGKLEFTPSEGQPFQTHFSIQNAMGSPLWVNCLLPLADSSLFYVRGWWRRKSVNVGC